MSDAKKPTTDEAGVPDGMLPAESVDESGSPLVEEEQTGAGAGRGGKDEGPGASGRK